MTRTRWGLSALLILPWLSACFASDGREGPTIDVDAAIAAASLADDCGGDADRIDGACAPDTPCPTFCQQSNVQLSFVAGEGEGPLPIQILEVTMHRFDTGELIQELTPREPQVWIDDSGYDAWDEMLPLPSSLDASYDLNAPDWPAIAEAHGNIYSMSFQLRVTVSIGGEIRTLSSGELYRVSDIDT